MSLRDDAEQGRPRTGRRVWTTGRNGSEFSLLESNGRLRQAWDDQTLDNFLAAPAKAVPGTTMMITVPSASDRADMIAYLKTIDAP
jgi:cytochrome c2